MKAAIVGYGPAGNVAAVGLYKQGWKVTVYEKQPNPYEMDFNTLKDRSYPLVFNSKGAKVLVRAGILPYFEKMKHCNRFNRVVYSQGQTEQKGEPKGFHGSWNGIMKTMLDSFHDLCPDAEIKFNTEVLDIQIQEGILKTASEETQFDLILGCDGVGSKVRSCGEAQNTDLKVYDYDTKRRAKSLWIHSGEEDRFEDALYIFSMNPPLLATYSRDHNNEYLISTV